MNIIHSKEGKISKILFVQHSRIYPPARIEKIDIKHWDHVINTNLTSALRIVKAALPTLQKQKYGRIIFTSSISGPRVGLPGYSAYTASKAGMNGFMRTLAIEVAKYNITVNAVEPGTIYSEGVEQMGEKHRKEILAAIPMGRLGTAEETAKAHLFLASDDAQYIAGQSIIVDGGQLLPETHYADY